MSTVTRTLRNLWRVGLKDFGHQMQYIVRRASIQLRLLADPSDSLPGRHKSWNIGWHRQIREQILRKLD